MCISGKHSLILKKQTKQIYSTNRNSKNRLIILFAPKMEKLYTVSRKKTES